jgi:hypothetical protein
VLVNETVYEIPTLKIGRRLLLAFGIQILFLAAIAGYALNRMQVLERHVTEIAAVNQREFASASKCGTRCQNAFCWSNKWRRNACRCTSRTSLPRWMWLTSAT